MIELLRHASFQKIFSVIKRWMNARSNVWYFFRLECGIGSDGSSKNYKEIKYLCIIITLILSRGGEGEMQAAIKTDDKKDNFIHIIFT